MTTSITSGQKTLYTRLVEDATRKAVDLALSQVNPDKEGMQKLLGRGDELRTAIFETVVSKTRELSLSNQFANEEVRSSFGYLSGYTVPKPIAEQVKLLRELFPELGTVDESIATCDLPAGAEGHFAIPRWEKIAPTYGEAVQKVLDLVKKTRRGKFYNYREGQLGPQHLRQHAGMAERFKQLAERQEGHDILVVPAQFGIWHRGRSVRRAREVMNQNEFGLGAFAVGIMLLTHPERLQHYDDLWIDCGGDEFDPVADGRFSLAPCFGFGDGGVGFGARWVGDAYDDFGSASGLSPQ